MTIYSTSFDEYTTDAAPSDWTSRWGTTGESWLVRADASYTAGKYLEHTRTTTLKRLFSWDAVDADTGRDDCELLVRWRSSSGFSADQFYLVLRGSGSSTNETGYLLYNTSSTNVRIAKIVSGTITSISSFSFSVTSNTMYTMRFRATGTALKAKIWASEHETEPTAWNAEATDSSITGTGWIGVGNAATTGTRIYDDVAVGTSGDTAAFPAADTTRVTQAPALVLASSSSSARSTQMVALALGGLPPVLRATQFASLVLYEPSAAMRATTFEALVLAEFFADCPITQMVSLVLADRTPCLTRWAQCWTITRSDGQVFAYTSHDAPVNFNGLLHMPCDSMMATASELSVTGGDTGNMELRGLLSASGISATDVYNGVFDNAILEVWNVPWASEPGFLETPFRLMAGTLGAAESTVDEFTFEVITDTARLKQFALLEIYSPTCRYNFGTQNDPRCPVDLSTVSVNGTVTSTAIPDASRTAVRRIFGDSSRVEANGYFALGTLVWNTGANAGATSEIKDFNGGTFVLWSPMLHPVEIGDTYTAYPGCDKSKEAHLVYNADMTDFGGFPDVPGLDSINQTPDAKT